MRRNMFPTAFALSTSTRDSKAGTYHSVLVSLGKVLHFVKAGDTEDGFGMIALSELRCGFV
jgi:hypothetical protein